MQPTMLHLRCTGASCGILAHSSSMHRDSTPSDVAYSMLTDSACHVCFVLYNYANINVTHIRVYCSMSRSSSPMLTFQCSSVPPPHHQATHHPFITVRPKKSSRTMSAF
jgi:hypothetical protein